MNMNNKSIPKHIALIMDGNGRWAKEKYQPRIFGHREGVKRVKEIIQFCVESDEIKFLTLYTFSSENWKRPKNEIKALMRLLLSTIRHEIKDLNKNNVRLMTIGNLNELPSNARKGMEEGLEMTKNNSGLNLILALSYGSRNEILRMVRNIATKAINGDTDPDKIKESDIVSELDTSNIPDPDLLIRTGGEFRLSNFLLWQVAYSEIYVTKKYWPEFRENELLEAIEEYQSRERRFGKIVE